MFLTSLKQTCNEYLIKFSENQSAPKFENRKTSQYSPCAPNLLQVLLSRIPGYHNLCSPGNDDDDIEGNSGDDDNNSDGDDDDNRQMLLVEYRLRWALHYSVTSNSIATSTMPL